MIDIDDQIRTVLHSQADAMRVPDVLPGEQVAHVGQMTTRRRPRTFAVLAAAAAVAVVVAGGAVLTQRDASPTALPPASTGPAFHFATPTVAMDADSVEVIAGGRSWIPTTDLVVDGDPGMMKESTTLELTWHDDGIEQRIHVYFRSDGVDWWAYEIRTYDGAAHGEWVEPIALGEFFRSPLGTAFVGDLDLPNLRIHGMTLQAFVPPSVCNNPTVPIALLADFPLINASVGEFGATFQMIDTATCTALPVAPYTFEYIPDDPNIVALSPPEEMPGYPSTKQRVGLQLREPGQTTLQVVATDAAGGLVNTTVMQITVVPKP